MHINRNSKKLKNKNWKQNKQKYRQKLKNLNNNRNLKRWETDIFTKCSRNSNFWGRLLTLSTTIGFR